MIELVFTCLDCKRGWFQFTGVQPTVLPKACVFCGGRIAPGNKPKQGPEVGR